MTNGSQLKPWAVAMLLIWDQSDPVSLKETNRNNAVYALQHNRNPFIDHPEYAQNIWNAHAGLIEETRPVLLETYPNPSSKNCKITVPVNVSKHNPQILVYTVTAKQVDIPVSWESNVVELTLETLPAGIYFVQILSGSDQEVYFSRIIKK